MEEFWNERYKQKEFAYGQSPNEYYKEQIKKIVPGSILLPAEGEGRNAVYAARQGWDVTAFDISIEGKNKALELAKKFQVSIDYQVGELTDLGYENEQFDALALIYAHFPPNRRYEIHHLLDKKLRKGGIIILEAFSKNNLSYRIENPKIGGPSNPEALFSMDILKSDFRNYDIIELEEKEIELNEGLYHNGNASVIRFLGRKRHHDIISG